MYALIVEIHSSNQALLTLSARAWEGCNSYFFCVSACLSETDFEDGFVLSLQTSIKAQQATV